MVTPELMEDIRTCAGIVADLWTLPGCSEIGKYPSTAAAIRVLAWLDAQQDTGVPGSEPESYLMQTEGLMHISDAYVDLDDMEYSWCGQAGCF